MTPPELPVEGDEPTYGSAKSTRFELELEFVQSLQNPHYLASLANSSDPPGGHLADPRFIAYLAYLQYWRDPRYSKYLHHPSCLRTLELLQVEAFRRDAGKPDFVGRMVAEGVRAGLRGPGMGGRGGEGKGEGSAGAGGGVGGQGTPEMGQLQSQTQTQVPTQA
eukprot:GHVU01049124.1.p1 GENE.GHVU01049124.1~~GHVU01049124.1.p1  ORF type:complete len:175 (+),score=17.68 GHVU01049124.1:34-525(+)